MPLGETVQGLAGQVLLRHLPLELDAVRTLLSGHGFHLSKARNAGQFTNFNLSTSRGALHGAVHTWHLCMDRPCVASRM